MCAVIPALDEEEAIGQVVRRIPRSLVREILVVDNGSRDRTAERAVQAGARVVSEPEPGYGRACRAGVAALPADCDVVVFLDGDGSDCPEHIEDLVRPIATGTHDFVIGSRIRGRRQNGSMNLSQLIAGRAAGMLLRISYGARYTDMCPLRAIRVDMLNRLRMQEQTYGWNLEMQMRAARHRLRILEIPVGHRRRVGGVSKVSGTIRGTLRASAHIAATFARVIGDRS
ncbi:MAG: glycosyltransferase family 2 protein [Candidatus Eremiobacteraeota bacterium]|nr:glycosyltransferase family 2 protein [Candidatus Eremiobacteraeota bacterium]